MVVLVAHFREYTNSWILYVKEIDYTALSYISLERGQRLHGLGGGAAGPFPVSQRPPSPPQAVWPCLEQGREEGDFVGNELHSVQKKIKPSFCPRRRSEQTVSILLIPRPLGTVYETKPFFSAKPNFGVEATGAKKEKAIPNSSNCQARGLPPRKDVELRTKALSGGSGWGREV